MLKSILARLSATRLRPLSALVCFVLAGIGIGSFILSQKIGGDAGRRLIVLSNFTMTAAILYAIWFGLLLTRPTRHWIYIASLALCVFVAWAVLHATLDDPRYFLGVVALGPPAALAWLSRHGIDLLERELHGREGERRVREVVEDVRRQCPATWALHDALLPAGAGLAQVDHILVAPGGVLVLETKSHAGAVFIDEHGNWCIEKASGYTKAIGDPTTQCLRQARAVIDLLPGVPVFYSVVMTNAQLHPNAPDEVMTVAEVKPRLHRFATTVEPGDSCNVVQVAESLRGANRDDADGRREHWEQIHSGHPSEMHPGLRRRLVMFAAIVYFAFPALLLPAI